MVNIKSPDEERLHSLSPSNSIIKDPALFHNLKKPKDWNGGDNGNDLTNWKEEMSVQDFREGNNNIEDENTYPLVRQLLSTSKKKTDQSVKQKKPAITEYEQSVKVEQKEDVDLGLRFEEVRVEENQEEERLLELAKQNNVLNEATENNLINKAKQNNLTNEAAVLPDPAAVRIRLADEKRLLGNQCFKSKNFTDAITHYTASIDLWPTAKSYNNRAASYIRLCKFSAALEDTNVCLSLEPNNTKALFRRSITYQHKNMFREALADMSEVLRREPSQVLALHIIKDLREQCLTLPRTLRFRKYDGPEVMEISSKDLSTLQNFNVNGEWYEVNDWGLPKVMCQCNDNQVSGFLRLAAQFIMWFRGYFGIGG